MNLPRGYANLSILSLFFHESRHVTIARAKAGKYRTAKSYKTSKLEVWIISQDELLEIMAENRTPAVQFVGNVQLVFKPIEDEDFAGVQAEVTMNNLVEDHEDVLDIDKCSSWVEEI